MKRLSALGLLALLGLLGACDDASGPEPVRDVDILLGPALADDQTITVGTTLKLSASAKSGSGQPLTGRAITWRSTIPSVASVDSTGLVTGLSVGSTLIIAAAESAADTTRVTVTAPVLGAPACAPGETGFSLAVGEVRTFTASQAASICLSGGATGSEYTYIPFNAAAASQTLALEIVGGGVVAAQGPPNPSRAPIRGSTGIQMSMAREDWGFHRRLRILESEMLARAATTPRSGILRSLTAAEVPKVGDTIRLSADPDATCSAPDLRAASVEAVSQRAIVVADSQNSAGGLTREHYQSFAVLFDQVIWPVITGAMGEPSDIDQNQRVILFFTRAVNDLTEEGSQSFVGGFFHPRDLNSNTGPGSCVATTSGQVSNNAEVLYMLTPDTARAAGNPRSPFSVAEVLDNTPGVIGHELQHVINASSRRSRGAPREEVWLNEGLSHIAEELLFYHTAQIDSETNLDVAKIRASERIRAAFNQYQGSNFGRFAAYLNEPEEQSLLGEQSDDDLPTRGATWAFLRYAADRKTDTEAAKKAIWFRLVNSSTAGITNVEQAIGVDALQWMQDWTVSVYTDDSGLPVAPQYQQPSWNFRDIYTVLSKDKVFPLNTLALSDGGDGVRLRRLEGGGAAFVRFGITPNGRAAVRVTAGGLAAPDRLRISIVRTK